MYFIDWLVCQKNEESRKVSFEIAKARTAVEQAEPLNHALGGPAVPSAAGTRPRAQIHPKTAHTGQSNLFCVCKDYSSCRSLSFESFLVVCPSLPNNEKNSQNSGEKKCHSRSLVILYRKFGWVDFHLWRSFIPLN